MRVEKLSDRRNRRADGAMSGRRQFLAQLTGLAGSGGVGIKARAAAGAESSPPAAPLPSIRLGTHRISRLVAGSNPILGYSYLGPHTDRHLKEYFTVERTVEFLENCERAGITAHQFADPNVRSPTFVGSASVAASCSSSACMRSATRSARPST